MLDFEFLDDRGAVGGDDDLSEVVDDEFVHAVGSEGGAGDGGDFAAGFDVAEGGVGYSRVGSVPFFEHAREAGGGVV